MNHDAVTVMVVNSDDVMVVSTEGSVLFFMWCGVVWYGML